jgi:hypothetical protein
MILKVIICSFALVLFSTAFLSAEVVEVPLPGLVGNYSHNDCHREAVFVLDPIPEDIVQVEIQLSGTHNVGEYYCQPNGTIEGPYPISGEIYARIRDTINDSSWYANEYLEGVSGAFEVIYLFQGYYGQTVTWEFLLQSGQGTVEFSACQGALTPFCWYDTYPDVTVEQATLLIETDPSVGVESKTWGMIKSLF